MDRRRFLKAAALGGAAAVLPWSLKAASNSLSSMTSGVQPIAAAEHMRRIARLQAAMRAAGLSAVLIESGSSLQYFTGVVWRRSERLTVAIIPAEGTIGVITPFFEEPSIREMLSVPADFRTWQEDEDALALVGGWLKDRRADKTVGIEETVRYFAVDGLAKTLPHAVIRSAAGPVRACRMIKSPAEIALMQMAADVTIAAYRYTAPKIEAGMTPADIASIMNGATAALGGDPQFALVLLGEASAYPHGSGKPQMVKPGEVVLMDCGCAVEGYQSDISRTFVFGEATARQKQVWEQVRQGQQTALAAARLGALAGSVDDAVRRSYERQGYGPGYRLPGTSHRTGHGIGLDVHEPINLVHGENGRLEVGMCFSDEPGIYIPGEFGIRLEDCFHMTPAGPRFFSTPPTSLERPFG